MKERIAEFIREKAYKPMTFAELATALGIPEKQHVQLRRTIEQMETTGEIIRTRLERYGAPERMNLAVGRLQGHPKGFGFLVADSHDADDIFIGREAMGGAWHGDRVVVRLHPSTRPGGRVEGEVIRILHRVTTRVVGTFEAARHAGYVTPDERRITDDIFIPKGATNGARSGEKVVVQVVEFPVARRSAEGRVIERLGMKGEAGVDIASVIRKFGLPEAFPPRILKECEATPEEVQPESRAEDGRRDLREWTIVTIDGEDARDLDDAVNLEKLGDDLWRLGVHIADVAYYVREGSGLDQEAYKRGTSVYLADRVVPMLPPRLSNGICSLNPGVERLTLSCVMEINGEGRVLRHEIFPSVIKTAARMTYTRVNEILDGDPETMQEYKPLVPLFREMSELMTTLRTRRQQRGSLDFDLPESKVELDEAGWPIDVTRVDRGPAEQIIEEFMLIANETVAAHCFRQGAPFMYRVHGEPAGDRLAGLRDFLALFGYTLRLPREGTIPPKLLQGITDWSRGRPEEHLINSVLLRTMRQAVYSDENQGHFGLAAEFYCHFTSPIRRYPDLIVHRVLRTMLAGGLNPKFRSRYRHWLPEAAGHLSERERVAAEAERETLDLKKAEYMSDKIDHTFEGIISGVTQFGFFVQLPNTVEGLVHVSTLTDDYYHFQENLYALVGERTRRRFRLGDRMLVRLNRVDVETRQIDFTIEENQAALETAAGESSAEEKPGRKRKRRKTRKLGMAAPETGLLEVVNADAPVDEPEPELRRAPVAAAPAEQPAPRRSEPAPERPSQGRPNTGRPDLGRANAGRPDLGRANAGRPVSGRPSAGRPASGRSASGRSSQVDMWGVPVPGGRSAPRARDDEDPGVVNPFSLTPPPRAERGGWDKAFAEAPHAPASGTADESAGLPAAPGVVKSRRPRRAPRKNGRSQQDQPRE